MRDWKSWGKASLIRAIKTIAQTAVASIGVASVLSEVDWLYVASASALAGVLSLLTSLAGIPEEDVYTFDTVDRVEPLEDQGGD